MGFPSSGLPDRIPVSPQQFNFLQRLALRFANVNLSALVAQADAPAIDTSPVAVPGVAPATDPGTPASGAREQSVWDQAFSLQNRDRLSRYQEYDELDHGDLSSQLDAIVDAVLVSDDPRKQAFKVEIKANVKVDNVCQAVLAQTGLQFKMREYLRDLLKYGDAPVSLWFDAGENITALQGLSPYFMRRRVDQFGRLLGGVELINGQPLGRAYWQTDPMMGGLGGNETPVHGWEAWQMLWLKYKKVDRKIYSDGSYLEDMRRDALKLRMAEASMVIARATRAYPRRIYTLDLTGKTPAEKRAAIKEFQQSLNLTELRNVDTSGNIVAGVQAHNPLDVSSDIFIGTAYATSPDGKLMPQLNDVKLEDPKIQGLTEIADVAYLRRKLYRKLSPAMMGEPNTGGEITQQDLAVARMLQNLASILEYQLIRPVLRLQCLLKGYTFDDKDVTVLFSTETLRAGWKYADAGFRVSMSRSNDISNGIDSVQRILREDEHRTQAEIDQILADIAKEMALRDAGKLPPLAKTASGATPDGGQSKPPNPTQVRKGSNSEAQDAPPVAPLQEQDDMKPDDVMKLVTEAMLRGMEMGRQAQAAPAASGPNFHLDNVRMEMTDQQVGTLAEALKQPPPNITVEAPVINVHVPEQPAPVAPIVNVQVPAQEAQLAPVIHVAAPIVNNILPEQAPPIVNNLAPELESETTTITHDADGNVVQTVKTPKYKGA